MKFKTEHVEVDEPKVEEEKKLNVKKEDNFNEAIPESSSNRGAKTEEVVKPQKFVFDYESVINYVDKKYFRTVVELKDFTITRFGYASNTKALEDDSLGVGKKREIEEIIKGRASEDEKRKQVTEILDGNARRSLRDTLRSKIQTSQSNFWLFGTLYGSTQLIRAYVEEYEED